jgi:hypothetical protein
MHKLQVGQATIAGFRLLIGQFGTALKIAWIPVAVMFVLQGVVLIDLAPAIAAMFDTQGGGAAALSEAELEVLKSAAGWRMAIAGIVGALAYVVLVTGWLQQVLRGDTPLWSFGFFRFGRREWQTVVAYLVMALVAGAALIVVSLIGAGLGLPSIIIVIPMMLVLLLVVSRLSMVFPMIAVGQGLGWRSAWEMTKGNTWRLVGMFVLVSLLVGVLSMVVNVPVGLFVTAVGYAAPGSIVIGLILPIVAYVAVNILGWMIMLGSLADAYRQLGGPGIGVPEEVLAVFDDA